MKKNVLKKDQKKSYKYIYKIKCAHYAPKDTHESMCEYFIANNDQEVMDYIDKEYNFNSGKDLPQEDFFYDDENEESYDEDALSDDDIYQECLEKYRQKILKNCGNIGMDFDGDDAYYGITQWGWEKLSTVNEKEINILLELKLVSCI